MPKKYTNGELAAYYLDLYRQNPDELGKKLEKVAGNVDYLLPSDPKGPAYPYYNALIQSLENFYSAIKKTAQNIEQNNKAAAGTSLKEAADQLKKFQDQFAPLGKFHAGIKKIIAKNPESEDFTEFAKQGTEPLQETWETFSEPEEYDSLGTLKEYGVKKKASTWIEEIQADIRKGGAVTADKVARILAARQLADTVAGDASRLESQVFTEGEIRERADQLMAHPAFEDFIRQNGYPDTWGDPYGDVLDLNAKLLTDGHGGKLEAAFADNVKYRTDVKSLPADLFGRYQNIPSMDYESYEAFIKANRKDYRADTSMKASEKAKQVPVRAAMMLVACQLGKNGEPMNSYRFEKKCREVYNSPEFRFMKRHYPDSLNLLTIGDFGEFGRRLSAERNAVTDEAEKDPDLAAVRGRKVAAIKSLLAVGAQVGTVKETEADQMYRNYIRQEFVKKYSFLGTGHGQTAAITELADLLTEQKRFNRKDKSVFETVKKTALSNDEIKDVRKALTAHAAELEAYPGPESNKLRAGLEKVIQAGNKDLNNPKYRAAFLTAAGSYYDVFQKTSTDRYNRAKAAVEKNAPKGAKPLYNPYSKGQGTKGEIESREKDYLKKHGKKFNAMISAANEYCIADKNGADPAKAMKLIDAILDYQNGKEKPMSGEARYRFDGSLSLLASVTMGTPMEKYLDRQIAHINKVRGAKNGDPSFIKKEDYLDRDELIRERDANLERYKALGGDVEEKDQQPKKEQNPVLG